MKIPHKIFGIALLVFAVMGSTIFYTTYKLYGVSREIGNLATVFIPVSDQLADIDIQIVEQELNIERIEKHIIQANLLDEKLQELANGLLPRHLTTRENDPQSIIRQLRTQKADLESRISREKTKFMEREQSVNLAIKAAETLVDRAVSVVSGSEARESLLSIVPLLRSVDLQHSNLHAQQAILIEAFQKDSSLQLELQDLIEKENRRLQAVTKETWESVARFTERSAKMAEKHEREALFVSVLLTLIAGLSALIVSSLVIRGMLRPLRNLIAAAGKIEDGDLSGRIENRTSDEIGDLIRSFNSMVDGLQKSEEIKEKFGQYVDPRVVSGLIGDSKMELINGEKKVVSVYFSDLVNFTGISERFTPSGLVRLINRYLTLMSGPITENQGLIDKYIGDAIMAFWTTPFCCDGKQAELAVRSALADIELMDKLQEELPELMGLRKDVPQLGMRVGIATGEALVGSIGSDTTKNYTVMGDTVNLGARLEGANKVYGTNILVCHRTYQMACDCIEYRKVDNIIVKGKTETVAIYEPLGLVGEINQDQLACRDQFETALEAFHAGDWKAANDKFSDYGSSTPHDPVLQTYLRRLETISRDGPPNQWNGVWLLHSK
ncbi:MAG: adenylate/guanylate cyclase domain-containing protein [Rhizobiaceae bacterium]